MTGRAEITALARRVTADDTGRVRLFFTLTNTGDAMLELGLSLALGSGIQAAEPVFEDGQKRVLDPRETGQITVELAMPPGARAGQYTVRLVAAAAGAQSSRSPTVQVTLGRDLPQTPVAPRRKASAVSKALGWLMGWWRGLRGLIGWFRARGFGFMLGTKRAGDLQVSPGQIKRYFIILVCVGFVLVLRGTALPALSSDRRCNTDACLMETWIFKALPAREREEQPKVSTCLCDLVI